MVAPLLLAAILAAIPARTPTPAAAAPAVVRGRVVGLELTSLTKSRAFLFLRVALASAPAADRQTFRGDVIVWGVPIPASPPIGAAVQQLARGADAVLLLDVDLARVPAAVLQKAQGDGLDVTVRGTLEGKNGKVAIRATGTLKPGTPALKGPPALGAVLARFEGARLSGLSLTETRGEARVALLNPFSFDLPVREITYALVSGGRTVASGRRTGVRIHGGRTNELSLPVEAPNRELLAVAGSLVGSGGTLQGRLVGFVTLKLGTADAKIPFDVAGKIEVTK